LRNLLIGDGEWFHSCMAHPHPPLSDRISRRDLLIAAVIATAASGCTSPSQRAAQRFFSAVHSDPLYSWRPEWATKDVTQQETGGVGFDAETRTTVDRTLSGDEIPSTALAAATIYAQSVGWKNVAGGYLTKDVTADGEAFILTLRIILESASQLLMEFTD
jgi:hypothetical protein